MNDWPNFGACIMISHQIEICGKKTHSHIWQNVGDDIYMPVICPKWWGWYICLFWKDPFIALLLLKIMDNTLFVEYWRAVGELFSNSKKLLKIIFRAELEEIGWKEFLLCTTWEQFVFKQKGALLVFCTNKKCALQVILLFKSHNL